MRCQWNLIMKIAKFIYATGDECSDLFFASGLHTPDAYIWFEIQDERAVILSALEYGRGLKECREGVAVYPLEEFFDKGKISPVEEVMCKMASRFEIEQFSVPYDFPLGLAEKARNSGLIIVPSEGVFFPEREFKQEDEIRKITEAMQITEDAMQTAIRMIADSSVDKSGQLVLNGKVLCSEDVRTEIEVRIMRNRGVATDTIVACGPQGADPHCCGYGPLHAGKPIIIDIFPRVAATGYYGDLTRTVVKGKAPSLVLKAYEAVKNVRDQAKSELKVGVIPADIHKKTLKRLSAYGFDTGKNEQGNYGFFHSLGHGLGLDVHEAPRLSPANTQPLQGGEVVTVEPGIYYPEWGGIRLEDVVWIRPDSCKCLTLIDSILEID